MSDADKMPVDDALVPVAALEVSSDTLAPKRRGHAFTPGHPRFGGRKKGTPNRRTQDAREIVDKMGFHPVTFLATVALKGTMPNPNGGPDILCDSAQRLDAAKAVAPYVAPKLAQTALTGANDGPVEVMDVTALLMDPEAARAAQSLGLKLAAAEAADGAAE